MPPQYVGPMREPVFTETMQLGFVVRDLEASIKRYVDDYGIGPWEIHEVHAGSAQDFREDGVPAERAWRLAVTMVGHVQWELIQPLDDRSVYARFLAEKGEGVHHVAVGAVDFDATVAEAERTKRVVFSGDFDDMTVVYLGTQAELGVTLELSRINR